MTEEQKKAKRKAYLREYQKAYRDMHKEKHKQYMRDYRAGLVGLTFPKTEPLIFRKRKSRYMTRKSNTARRLTIKTIFVSVATKTAKQNIERAIKGVTNERVFNVWYGPFMRLLDAARVAYF